MNRAKKYFDPENEDIVFEDIEELLEKIAQKIILVQGHKKYDMTVVSNLIKKVKGAEKKILYVKLEDLKVGMTLMFDLRLHDGRLLLVKNTALKNSFIQTIQQLGKKKLVADEICVNL
jgi:hypothetical protein